MPGAILGTAVVVDRWPLVRLGLIGVLSQAGFEVVGQAAKVSEGLLQVRLRNADLVVFGSPLDEVNPASIRSARHHDSPPRIVVLVPPGAEVAGLFAAGADALLAASVGPEEMADALARIGRGERVVGPELGPGRGDQAPTIDLQAPPAPTPPDQPPAPLTAKELEVLAYLAQGNSYKQIARALYVSDATVKTHVQHIYGKLAVQNRFGALARAAQLGLLGAS